VKRPEKVLILGATGMLGHTLLARLSESDDLDVHATARNLTGLSQYFAPKLLAKLRGNVDADNFDSILRTMAEVKPDLVINCIGIIKQLPIAQDPLICIAINALFPHRLAQACKVGGARMIHISTDCVFSGDRGGYAESDQADSTDLYGRSKFLGEVVYPHCVTLRTSIIGHELNSTYGLVDWFLSQKEAVRGFARAIFSGFPTIELARIILDYVLPNNELAGLYHVSSDPITKYDLLRLVADRYGKEILIEQDNDFRCDRSLDSSRFRLTAGYVPPPWHELIEKMHDDAVKSRKLNGGM
jgi:dTDP-4-dehydrorhamnose reductase